MVLFTILVCCFKGAVVADGMPVNNSSAESSAEIDEPVGGGGYTRSASMVIDGLTRLI